jgi:hypothetical protein
MAARVASSDGRDYVIWDYDGCLGRNRICWQSARHVFPTSRTRDAATAEVASSSEALARKYVAQAMQALVKFATIGKLDGARLAAATAILDWALVGHALRMHRRAIQTCST